MLAWKFSQPKQWCIRKVSDKSSWRVIERGVNDKPFLWKKRGRSRYVLIDIFNAHRNRCYAVLALESNPLATPTRDFRGRVIGMGCADSSSDWVRAYGKAREIADCYMNRHSGRRASPRK
jgi:hypothetical protein